MVEWNWFQELWKKERAEMSAQEYQNLLLLLHTKDEDQIASTFSLLMSYGECALCESRQRPQKAQG